MEHKKIQRRNSILKEVESVNIQVFENGEEQTVTGAFNRRSFKKRVSFADTTSIKEFLASRDAQATEWNCTYEEPVVHDSSSSMEITKTICQANVPVSKAPEGIRLTEDLAYMKENIVDLHKGSLEVNQGTNDGAEETYEVSNFLIDFLGMKPTEPNHGGTSDKKKKDISLASSDAQLQKTLMLTEDMEMTCNVPQHPKIIMSSEDIVMSNKVNLQNDLKMTNAVLPQKTLLSSSEMEITCKVPHNKSLISTENIEMIRSDPQEKTYIFSEDMDITCKIPQHQKSLMVSTESLDIPSQVKPLNNLISTEDNDDTGKVHHKTLMTSSIMEMTCKVPHNKSLISTENFEMIKSDPQEKTFIFSEDMDITCKIPQHQKSLMVSTESLDIPSQVKLQNNLISTEDNDDTGKVHHKTLMTSSIMEMTCKVPHNKSLISTKNFEMIKSDPQEKTFIFSEDMDITCKIPQHQKSLMVSTESLDIPSKVKLQNNLMSTEDNDGTGKVHHKTLMTSTIMEMTCKNSHNKSLISTENIEMIRSDPQEKTLIFSEDMDITCKIPQHQKSLMVSTESIDIPIPSKVKLQNNLMSTEDNDGTGKVHHKTLMTSSIMETTCNVSPHHNPLMNSKVMDMTSKVQYQQTLMYTGTSDMEMPYNITKHQTALISTETMEMTAEASKQSYSVDVSISCKVPDHENTLLHSEDPSIDCKLSPLPKLVSTENTDKPCNFSNHETTFMANKNQSVTSVMIPEQNNLKPVDHDINLRCNLPLEFISGVCGETQDQLPDEDVEMEFIDIPQLSGFTKPCENGICNIPKNLEMQMDIESNEQHNALLTDNAISKANKNNQHLSMLISENVQELCVSEKHCSSITENNSFSKPCEQSSAEPTEPSLSDCCNENNLLDSKVEVLVNKFTDKTTTTLEVYQNIETGNKSKTISPEELYSSIGNNVFINCGSIETSTCSHPDTSEISPSQLRQPIDGLLTAPITNRANPAICVSLVCEDLFDTNENPDLVNRDTSIVQNGNITLSLNTENKESFSNPKLFPDNSLETSETLIDKCEAKKSCAESINLLTNPKKRVSDSSHPKEPNAKVLALSPSKVMEPQEFLSENDLSDLNGRNRCQNDSQVLSNVNVSENLENEFKEDELIQDIELDLVEEEMEAVHNDLKCNVQDSSLELSDKAQQFLVAKSKLKEVIDNLATLPIKTSPYCVTHETMEEQRNLDESIFEFNNTLNVEMEKDNTGTDANYSTFKLKEALNPTKVDYQNICDQFVNDVEKEENKMEICESNLKTSAGIEPILDDEEPQHEFSTYKCKFCSPAFTKDTRQLTTPSGQVFDVSLLENGVLELKKNNPFRILFDLSCKNDHLTVIRVVWKPLLQDLKKPSAKLSLATLGQSISIETDKLLSLTFCEAVNHLDKVIEAYERVMKLLTTLRMIESVHLTSFSNTGLKVTFSNVKAALKVCVTLELIYDLNEKFDFFRVISTPTVVIGNLRNENLEEAISKVQNGPNKIFKIVKTLASIVRNAT